MPCACRIAPIFPAIQASPAAVGCRRPSACWYFHCPVSGSMMIAFGSAALAAATIAASVR